MTVSETTPELWQRRSPFVRLVRRSQSWISSPVPEPTFLDAPADWGAMSEAERDAVLDGMIAQFVEEQGLEVVED
jgi:hypothetical protein